MIDDAAGADTAITPQMDIRLQHGVLLQIAACSQRNHTQLNLRMDELPQLSSSSQQRTGGLMACAAISGDQVDKTVLINESYQQLKTAEYRQTVKIYTTLAWVIVQQARHWLPSGHHRLRLAHQLRIIGPH